MHHQMTNWKESRYYYKLHEPCRRSITSPLISNRTNRRSSTRGNVPTSNIFICNGKMIQRSHTTRINTRWNSPNTLFLPTTSAPGINAVVCDCNRLCAGDPVTNLLQRESTVSVGNRGVVRAVAARYRCEAIEADPPPTCCCCLYCHVGRPTM